MELQLVTDNNNDNNFNVLIGCKYKNKDKSTFVVLKMSERCRVIATNK
jgi:hypothetical protein